MQYVQYNKKDAINFEFSEWTSWESTGYENYNTYDDNNNYDYDDDDDDELSASAWIIYAICFTVAFCCICTVIVAKGNSNENSE